MRIAYLSYDGMTDPLGQSQVLPYLCGLSERGYNFTLFRFEKQQNLPKMNSKLQEFANKTTSNWQRQLILKNHQ